MDEDHLAHLAHKLHSWGLSELAAAFLTSARPLAFLGAQALYFAEPVLGALAPENDVLALAQLLEDPAAARAFADRLTEEA
jgi:hypothetical protein